MQRCAEDSKDRRVMVVEKGLVVRQDTNVHFLRRRRKDNLSVNDLRPETRQNGVVPVYIYQRAEIARRILKVR